MMKRTRAQITERKRGQRGMTLLELLIAGAILTIGLLSLMGLASVAIMSNSRNRMDGTSNMLAQQVVEHIHYALGGTGSFPVTDCLGNTYTISSIPGGALLTNGQIDYSESTPPTGYHMNFAICSNPTTSSYTVYDVRWNIEPPPASYDTYLVTVSAKPVSSSTDRRMFALPVNMRVLVTGVYQ